MLINKTVIVTALAVFATMLVPVSSAAAVPGGLLGEEESEGLSGEEESEGLSDEEESNNVTETRAVPIGELPADEGVLVATEYQGNRIAVSTQQETSFLWSDLQNDELAAARLLIGDNGAYGKRATSSNISADFLAVVSRDGFSVLVEIASADSASEYVFDLDLPDGSTLILTDEGSVDVLGNDRFTIGEFEVPWAVDAHGNPLSTHFKVDGDTITQVVEVDETTAYPVVADPHFTWGWFTGTVYFNKWETLVLCSGSLNTLRTLVIVPFWLPIVFAVAAVIFLYACTARLLDKCIKVKSTGSVLFYTGGYCT